MADLVSYNVKRNDANGEQNQDGENHNLSWNCGVEGPTDDRRILDLRGRQRRNLMATLMLSVGVPMISGGDEVGRTQQGNNNAYCQDNEISWTRWDLAPTERDFLTFVRRLIKIRKDHAVLRRRKFFQGRRIRGKDVLDITWLDASGREMADDTWNSPGVRCLGVRLNGDAIDEIDERGERIAGATLVMLLNAGVEAIPFVLPALGAGERWVTLLDTADPWQAPRSLRARERYQLQSRSMAVLRLEGGKRYEEWGPMGVY
jgi:glycogen operon protein